MNPINNIVSPSKLEEESDSYDTSLRPQNLNDFIGKEKEKRGIKVMIDSAKKRKDVLDHILFSGPPGLGKTSLAYIVAHEMGVPIVTTSGPAIERQGDLASIISNIEDGGIFFIDEVHRLNRSVEEILYPAMEDRVLDIIIGKGPAAKTLRLDLPKFTIIGATTRVGLMSSPLRDRFGAHFKLEFYDEKDLSLLVEQKATILKISITSEGANEIAKRSRGTARIAVRLLKRVRDLAEVKNIRVIDRTIADEALKMYEIDSMGLTNLDRKILHLLMNTYDGGPAGLSTISAAIAEDQDTIEDFYEPFLLQIGFLQKTPRGRVITLDGIKHLSSVII